MSFYSIRKILVPVDLSEGSLNALDSAVALAVKHDAELEILSIEEQDPECGDDLSYSAAPSHDILQALAHSIQHTYEIKPRLIQESGNVSDCIVRTALLSGTDLIVMGTHGASGYRDGFMGSNTYSVFKNATCQVLCIPTRKKYIAFRRVLFPVRPVTGALIRYDVLHAFLYPKAELSVLGLSYRRNERDDNILDKVVEEIEPMLQADNVQTRIDWGSGQTLADDVIRYAHNHTPDLLVVTPLLDVADKPRFVGPHTQKILHCVKLPILSIKRAYVGVLT